MKKVANGASRYSPTPDASPAAERAEHHDRFLRIVDRRAITHETRRADDAERARKAVAHHEHDDRTDDGEHDLGLDDQHGPTTLAAAPGPKRERGAKDRGEREAHQRVLDLGHR